MAQGGGVGVLKIVAHGWWVIDGVKMGKSPGNAIQPLDLAEVYGVDAFRYFLLRDAALDRDAEYSRERLESRYQGDLANDLGNLLHRLAHMVVRHHDGLIPTPGALGVQEEALRGRCLALAPEVFALIDPLADGQAPALGQALARVMSVVGEINGYLERTAPWRGAKIKNWERVATILYVAAEALRLVSVLLYPVLPERMGELWRRLGW